MLLKINKLPVIAFFAMACLLVGCNKKDDSAARGAFEVSSTTVESQSVPLMTELPGRTSAVRIAEVRPQVGGVVLKKLFEEGSEVHAGQQLYQIDPALYKAALQSAEADLAKAKAALVTTEAKANRYAELIKIDAISRQDYDDEVAALEQAKAQVLSTQAAVDTARINLDYTKVYAPISGRISKSNITEGALVAVGQTTALTTITQLDPIYVDLTRSSSEILQLREAANRGHFRENNMKAASVGLSIDGSHEAYQEKGKLQFSDVIVDPTTGDVQLRALFPNPNHLLLPGLFVRAKIEVGNNENVVLIPQKALIRMPDGTCSVWIVAQDNKVAQRTVEVGRSEGDKWIVTKGLAAGETIVTSGFQKIHEGMSVRIADSQNVEKK